MFIIKLFFRHTNITKPFVSYTFQPIFSTLPQTPQVFLLSETFEILTLTFILLYHDPELHNNVDSQLLETAATGNVCQTDPGLSLVLHGGALVLAGLCGRAAHLQTTQHVVRAAAVADLSISGLLIRSGPGMISG